MHLLEKQSHSLFCRIPIRTRQIIDEAVTVRHQQTRLGRTDQHHHGLVISIHSTRNDVVGSIHGGLLTGVKSADFW